MGDIVGILVMNPYASLALYLCKNVVQIPILCDFLESLRIVISLCSLIKAKIPIEDFS